MNSTIMKGPNFELTSIPEKIFSFESESQKEEKESNEKMMRGYKQVGLLIIKSFILSVPPIFSFVLGESSDFHGEFTSLVA